MRGLQWNRIVEPTIEARAVSEQKEEREQQDEQIGGHENHIGDDASGLNRQIISQPFGRL
jgi:hypothetical protein